MASWINRRIGYEVVDWIQKWIMVIGCKNWLVAGWLNISKNGLVVCVCIYIYIV